MKNLTTYLPALLVIAGFLLVSFGAFMFNHAAGLIVSGVLLFALAYMFSNKGEKT